MLKFFPGGASTVPSESAVSCCDPRSAWMRGAGAWGPGAFVVSGCVAAAAEEPCVTVCAYLCVRVRKRERCVRLCCWLMSGEGSGRSRDHKGNPGRTVKSSIRVWSCESVAVCKCVWAWGLRGVEEQDWHQQARDETARYWHSLVRLREVDFS